MTNLRPPPLAWTKRIASEAQLFFTVSVEHRTSILGLLGRTQPEGQLIPFSTMDFLRYMAHIGVEDVWPRATQVERILRKMQSTGILTDSGRSALPMFADTYLLNRATTRRQQDGVLWMAPILGSKLIIDAMSPSVVHITGCDDRGDEHGGTGILLDERHVLTAAHVLTDMSLHEHLKRHVLTEAGPAVIQVRILGKVSDPARDVGLIEIDSDVSASVEPTPGLAFRDPAWADRIHILGFPPVPMTIEAAMTVQTGEVVNPGVKDYSGGEWFLFSAIARPGNSGGPIIAEDGRVTGIVTRAFSVEGTEQTVAAPFYVGIPTRVIADALQEMGFDGVLPVEDWT